MLKQVRLQRTERPQEKLLRFSYNLDDAKALAESESCVPSVVVTYYLLDQVSDLFAKVKEARLCADGKEAITVEGRQWSTINSLTRTKVYKDRDQSRYYVRFPIWGNLVFSKEFTLTLVFSSYDNEHERMECHAAVCPRGYGRASHVWAFSPWRGTVLEHKQETVEIEFEPLAHRAGDTCLVAQLVYFIPGATKVIRGGEVLVGDEVVQSFEHPFEASVLDKMLTGVPVPEGAHVLTCTFTDWTRPGIRVSDTPLQLYRTGDDGTACPLRARLRLDGAEVPDGASLFHFAVWR